MEREEQRFIQIALCVILSVECHPNGTHLWPMMENSLFWSKMEIDDTFLASEVVNRAFDFLARIPNIFQRCGFEPFTSEWMTRNSYVSHIAKTLNIGRLLLWKFYQTTKSKGLHIMRINSYACLTATLDTMNHSFRH